MALTAEEPYGPQDQLRLGLGFNVIRSYKRLSYTPWYALAEFVDNSTQAYFNNSPELDEAYSRDDDGLEVSIVYDRTNRRFRISDNSIGMSLQELSRALVVGQVPANTSGRSQYGMGLKTAACWFGDMWSVTTKRLGETQEYRVTVDVESVANGHDSLPHDIRSDVDPNKHYTIVEIWDLNQLPVGRTVGKIKSFLRSIYRQDLRAQRLRLLWDGAELTWDDSDQQFLKARDGSPYRTDFDFTLRDGKRVHGWIGVLDRGGRDRAGLAILHSDRVVKGWPDSWRPESIFGQYQGSNDLVNQRIVGEVHLDAFEVTHTKDDILWMGLEEEVEQELKKVAAVYVQIAKTRRKSGDSSRGPSEIDRRAAVDEFQAEITSPEIVDLLSLSDVPPPGLAAQALRPVLASVASRQPDFGGQIGTFSIAGYLASDLSPNDPYVAVDASSSKAIAIVLNINHPFVEELVGSEGFLNYLRQSTYDAVAEWRAMQRQAPTNPDTIKFLKDQLLRLPAAIEVRTEAAEAEAEGTIMAVAEAASDHDGDEGY